VVEDIQADSHTLAGTDTEPADIQADSRIEGDRRTLAEAAAVDSRADMHILVPGADIRKDLAVAAATLVAPAGVETLAAVRVCWSQAKSWAY
jgi:hypothetical protein